MARLLWSYLCIELSAVGDRGVPTAFGRGEEAVVFPLTKIIEAEELLEAGAMATAGAPTTSGQTNSGRVN